MVYKYNFCSLLGFRFAAIVNRWFIYDETDLSQCGIISNSCEFHAIESQIEDNWNNLYENLFKIYLKSEVRSDFWELKKQYEDYRV